MYFALAKGPKLTPNRHEHGKSHRPFIVKKLAHLFVSILLTQLVQMKQRSKGRK